MHLLAESGATKTEWYLYDANGLRLSRRTSGMNPNIHLTSTLIAQQLEEWEADLPTGVTHIDFYGAGLGAPTAEAHVRGTLAELFPDAEVTLATDMLAAARAAAGTNKAIVSILGTGSNSCYWDGQAITGNLGSHGYLFTDEGSGADIARHIIGLILNEEMPHDVTHFFKDWVKRPLLEVRTEIYQAPKVNVALAAYAPFVSAHLDHPVIFSHVVARFLAFLGRTVTRFHAFRELPLHFVGSVAAAFEPALRQALTYNALEPASILAQPGEALYAYHLAQLQATRA